MGDTRGVGDWGGWSKVGDGVGPRRTPLTDHPSTGESALETEEPFLPSSV